MPIRDRVNQVLADWCGADPDSIDQTMSLEEIWESTRDNPQSPHSAIPFQPDGVEDLLIRLRKEFTNPGADRKDTSGLTPGCFKPSGDIDTVDHLVTAVIVCPNRRLAPAGETGRCELG